MKGLCLRWLSFIAVRAKLEHYFRYGCVCGTAAVPILLAFYDVVFEPTFGNRYRLIFERHETYCVLFFVYVGLAFVSGTFIRTFIERSMFVSNSLSILKMLNS